MAAAPRRDCSGDAAARCGLEHQQHKRSSPRRINRDATKHSSPSYERAVFPLRQHKKTTRKTSTEGFFLCCLNDSPVLGRSVCLLRVGFACRWEDLVPEAPPVKGCCVCPKLLRIEAFERRNQGRGAGRKKCCRQSSNQTYMEMLASFFLSGTTR